VSVSLERRRYVDGARRLVAESGGSTDDRGEFRIFGVPPGDYVIVARFDAPDLGLEDRVRYVPTYYPWTPVASEAQRVAVAAWTGSARDHDRARPRGHRLLSAASFVPPARHRPGRLTLVTAREISGPQAYGEPMMAMASPDQSFAIAGLLPGTYIVEARSFTGSEVASKECRRRGIRRGRRHAAAVEGRDGARPDPFRHGRPPQGLRPSEVLLMPAFVDSPADQMFGASGGPPVAHDDWTFELPGLRGRGFIRAGTMGDWQLKRVRREGIDRDRHALGLHHGRRSDSRSS
jgi:hypothetical protein